MKCMGKERDKIVSIDDLQTILAAYKKKKQRIIHCHGVFDLIHPGHIKHLKHAKEHGAVLVVSIPPDHRVRKGPGRPIFTASLRAEQLSALSSVDYVTIADATDTTEVIRRIAADVFVVGPEKDDNEDVSYEQIQATVAAIGAQLITTNDPVVFSSSSLINTHIENYPASTKEYLTELRRKYSIDHIKDLLAKVKTKRILLIGDTIIDQYQYTIAMGKSSKAPLVVHRYVSEESFAGGILATSNHVSSICPRVKLVTVLGKTDSWEQFVRKHLVDTIRPRFFFQANQTTLIDRRFVDYYTKQKLFQMAIFNPQSISKHTEEQVVTTLKSELSKSDIVIVNDFGRGFITDRMVRLITSRARYLALNVQANSANYGFNIITKYPRADFICLDEVELRLAMHDKYTELPKLLKKVSRQLDASMGIVTRGADGSIVYEKKNGISYTPALATAVVDAVGAGDAFFAIASPFAAIGADASLVAFIGNVAGAIKVQTIGNKHAIDEENLRGFIIRLLR